MAFPVEVTNATVIPNAAYYNGNGTNSYGLQQTVTQAQISAAPSGGANFGNTFALNGSFGPQPGKAMEIRSIYVSSTKRATFQARVGVGTAELQNVNIPEMQLAFIAGGTDTAGYVYVYRFDVNWCIRNGQSFILYITKLLDGATETTVAWWPNQNTITDNFNYNARHWIAWVGTSITNGTGPTSTAYMYHTLFESHLRYLGKSVRNELYGISGSTSGNHYTKFTRGDYDVMPNKMPPSVVFIELAVNDASAGTVTNTYVSRLRTYTERMLTHPEKEDIMVVILSATPLQNTTAYNNSLVLDAAAQAMVDELAAIEEYAGRIFFIPDLAGSFDRTVFGNYASTDVNGQGIHPNNTGQSAIANNRLIPWLDTADGQTFLNGLL